MPNAGDITEQYLSAFYRGDSQTARRYLADDLSFSGPTVTFANADDYLEATEHARQAVKGVALRKVFVDGPDVCIIYDLTIDDPAGTIPIADWYHLEDDKISSIHTILDTAPFAARDSEHSADTALDPVCHMTVPRASAATRHYRGTTYYFCNPGCAQAFDTEPEKYLPTPR